MSSNLCNTNPVVRSTISEMLVSGLPVGTYNRFYGLESTPHAPSTSEQWTATTFSVADGYQDSLAGSEGKRRYNKIGFVIVQCFGPLSDQGYTKAEQLAAIVESIFQGKTGRGGIRFTNCSSTPVGPSDAWYQYNVTINFEFPQYI